MRFLTWILLLPSLISLEARSQDLTVRGTVTDSVNRKQLANSSVILLRSADSVMQTFSRAGSDGSFSLRAKPGQYFLLISYPGFADYTDSLRAYEGLIDLGTVFLTPRSKLLEEIIIQKKIPSMRMKGDTIVYKADSFQVKTGASVEDLLKTLPGISVDRNGNITAQGERVRKILVDGEEFFSDDPTIATRNLQSGMVDELEVFDKKSEQADFTGIDDGQRTKTINLKLKEDKKNGYFGKLEAGSDMNKYWSNSAMLNYFKGKKKIAAHGLMASDGKTGLDFGEMMNYGGMGGMETEMMEGGGLSISIETADDDFDFGRFEGEGLPRAWSSGLHFSNKWDKDRKNLNGNYRFKKLNNEALVTNRSQNILPDTTFFVNERSNVYTSKQSHSLQGIYDIKLDSTSSLKMAFTGLNGNSQNSMLLNSESLSPDGDTINKGTRAVTSEMENRNFNGSVTYRKKFRRAGQTFSATLRFDQRNRESDGFLRANNEFYDSKGILVRQDLFDQEKISKTENGSYSGRFSYTHPLSAKSFLEFNYQLSQADNYSLRRTLEKADPASDKYEVEVPALSNEFDFNSLENRGGMNYKFSKSKKINFSVGGAVSQTQFRQHDLRRDSIIRYNFLNFFPQASLMANLKGNKNLHLRYSGRTQQPTVNMLQPVVDNTDPLNVAIGNPDLSLALVHDFDGWLGRYDMLSESGYMININVSASQNAFSQRTFTDSLGRRLTQTVNVDGVFSTRMFVNLSKKLKKTRIEFNLTPEFAYMQNVNIVNGEENRTRNGNVALGMSARYNKDKKYNVSLSYSPNYHFSSTSIRTDIETNYWLQSLSFGYGWSFVKKWELSGDISANFRQQTEAFPEDNNAILWNMWLDRKFGKNDNVKLRLYAFDILNQNIGFQRTISSNFINERTYNTFNRYLMLSFIWNFSKNGKPVAF
jgi:hypothetical protein